jgi:hypothetical protein
MEQMISCDSFAFVFPTDQDIIGSDYDGDVPSQPWWGLGDTSSVDDEGGNDRGASAVVATTAAPIAEVQATQTRGSERETTRTSGAEMEATHRMGYEMEATQARGSEREATQKSAVEMETTLIGSVEMRNDEMSCTEDYVDAY